MEDGGADVAALERRWLLVSLVATISLAVLAVAWGIVSGSQIILFDGMYAVVGIVLVVLSLRASRLVAAGPSEDYPFGREALSPLVIGIQGVAVVATCAYASVNAVLVIVSGGSDISANSALVYGVITLLASVVVWIALRTPSRRSGLLAAESAQWLTSVLLGVALVVAFTAVVLLERSGHREIGRYVDPALVLLACAVLAPIPVRMIRTTLAELLEHAPDPEIREQIHAAVRAVRARFDLGEPYVRATKVGPKLYVEVDFVVDPTEWSVAEEDAVRHALQDELATLPHDPWLTLELTGDEHWAR